MDECMNVLNTKLPCITPPFNLTKKVTS